MRRGERNIYIAIAVLIVGLAVYRGMQDLGEDPGFPFHTTASTQLQIAGEEIYKDNNCSDCHTLWMVRNWYQSVPAPALDGIGSLRDEDWLYNYLSADNPQSMQSSRLKAEFRMPSYAHLPESERRTLAAYLASLKVDDWFLEDVKKARHEVLTGEPYIPDNE